MKRNLIYISFLLIAVYFRYSYAQSKTTDSLSQLLKQSINDTIKIQLTIMIADEMSLTSPDSSIKLLSHVENLLKELPLQKEITPNQLLDYNIKVCRIKGDAFNYMGNFSKSLDCFQQAITLIDNAPKSSSNEQFNLKQKSNIYSSIGVLCDYYAKYPEALKYLLDALKINESLGDKTRIASSYFKIGGVYYGMHNLQTALTYFFKALDIYKGIGNTRDIARCYGNIGIMYKVLHQVDSSIYYYQIAIKAFEQMGDINAKARGMGNLANLYREMSAMPENKEKVAELQNMAMKNYFEILSIFEQSKNKNDIAIAYGNIGHLYLEMKNYHQSELYLLKALKYSAELQATNLIADHYEFLSMLYSEWKKDEKALDYYKKFIAARDNMNNEENTKKQVQLEMQYEFDKKESIAKAEQEKKDAIALAEKQRQQTVLYLISSVLLLFILFATFIYRSLRITKKQKIIIEQQKLVTEEQKQLMEEKQKEILDSIRYAKRIQYSLLPTEKYVERNLVRLRKK